MHVRSDHEGLAAVLRLTIVSILTAGSLIGVFDASTGHRPAALQFAAFIVMFIEILVLACVVALSLLFIPASLFIKRSWVRGAARADDAAAPLAPRQPNPTLALRPGETIELQSQMPRQQFVKELLWCLLVPLSFVVACETLVFSYNSLLFSWLSNPPQWTALPDVAPTTWLGVVAPLITACTAAWWGLRWLWRRSRQAISVGDMSITIKHGGRRPVQMPFAALRIFLRTSYGGTSTAGSYHIAGERQAATFTIQRAGNPAIAAEDRATHADRARRLVATIAARSGVTLRLPYFLAHRLQIADALRWRQTSRSAGYSKILPAAYQPAASFPLQRIRRTGSVRAAWGWFLAAILSAAPQVALLVAIQSGWMGATPNQGWYAIFVPSLAVSAILLLCSLAPLVRGARLRAAVQQRTRVLRYVTPVPDLTQALAPGETLLLERFGQPIGAIVGYCGFFVLPFFLFFGLLFPVNDPSLYTMSQPLWLWPVLALPFLDGAGLAIFFALLLFATHRQRIQVDDHGITIRRTLRRTRRIAWEAIKGLYRPLPADQSVLRIIESGRSTRLALGGSVIFKGGLHDYYGNMQRLLATIIARSHVALMGMPPNRVIAQNHPPSGTDEDLLDMMSVPESIPDHLPSRTVPTALAAAAVVPLRQQPSAADLTFASVSLPLVLRRRIVWRFLIGYSVLMLGIACVGAVWGLIADRSLLEAQDAIVLIVVLNVYHLPIFFGHEYILCLRGTLIADEWGIRRRRLLRPASTIAWHDIEQWIVVRRNQGATVYALIGHRWRLTWREPADIELGRQRAAYRARAAAMRALIAQRTGLKLFAIAR